jgi:hypothetical protein
VIALTETWMNSNNMTDRMFACGDVFDTFRDDRIDRTGGGVGLLVHKRLQATEVLVDPRFSSDCPNCQLICVDFGTDVEYRLILIYRPPGYVTLLETTHLFRFISFLCNDTDNVSLVIGDFNLPGVNWSGLYEGLGEDSCASLAEAGLTQLVEFPTTTSSSTGNILDLVFATDSQYVLSVTKGEPLGASFHHSVYFELYLSDTNLVGVPNVFDPDPRSTPRDYLKGNYEVINEYLLKYNWESFYRLTDLNDAYIMFRDVLMSVVDENCPARRPSKGRRRNFPQGMRSRYKTKRKMYRNMKSPLDRLRYNVYSKKCGDIVRQYYDEMEKKVVESKDKFYSYLNDKLKSRSDIISVVTPTGKQTQDKVIMSELFADHFATVCNNIPVTQFMSNNINAPSPDYSDGFLNEFHVDETMVRDELNKLPCKQTISADNIPPVVLRNCANALTGPITHLLRMSLSKGAIPDLWRKVLVKPIHKKGNKKLIKNYRPIGLTCILSKVCERLVRSQLIGHLTTSGFCTDSQHGFRTGRSTVTALLQTQLEWKRLLCDNSEFFVVLLDFSKAFDMVNHGKLREKLASAGIRDKAYCWISDYLDRRTMSVVIGSEASSEKPIGSGVIQGSAVGPALFSFFAYDIPECLDQSVGNSLFADDVKLYAVEKDILEESTERVRMWSMNNALPLAPDKTVFIKIRRRRTPVTVENFTIGGTTVESTKTTRDLGVLVSDDLECSNHIADITKKAFRTSNLILRILKTKKIELFKKAFYALVLPGLEYCSVIWCPTYGKDIRAIEVVQRRFTRRAQQKCGFGVEDYNSRLKRWNIPSLEDRRVFLDLVMVFKILYGYVDLNRDDFFRIRLGETLSIYPVKLASRVRTNTQLNTLASRTYKRWNCLPTPIRNSPSVCSFKIKLKKLYWST